MDDTKVTRNRLRRAAQRQGLKLTKSRRRDPRALDYARYWLLDLKTESVVVGGERGVAMEAVARFLGEGGQA